MPTGNGRALGRRQLVALGGAAAAGWLLRGCSWRPGDRVRPSFRPSRAPSLPSPAGPAEWAQLRAQLAGALVLPGDADYERARQLYHPDFDRIAPQAVAYCRSVSDVQRCLAFVREHGLPVAVRSGGHSYAGYSTTTGLVVDVSAMADVVVDPASATARVGAGAQQVDVYAGLARRGVLVPGGSCPTVGIAGLALGGGIGVLDRKFGLTLDNLVALEIVTADGTWRRCDATREADLFWACRGAGGGNFGVVVALEFRTHPAQDLTLFTLDWDWEAAPVALGAWLAWAPEAPDELWSNCILSSGGPGGRPALHMGGVYVGRKEGLGPLLDGLERAAGARPSSRSVWESGFLDAMLGEAGCAHLTPAQCHRRGQTAGGVLPRQPFAAKSDFLSAPFGTRGVQALVQAVEDAARLGSGAVLLDACGGAMNRVPPDATAFCHRGHLCSVQYYTSWASTAPPAAVQAQRAWLQAVYAAMRPYASGYAYQNYIDPDLPDWPHAYYGANFPRLVAVKGKYDPDNVFRFPQGIPPSA
jgi:FAD/FMN-containing dehydrogenase